VVQYRKSKKIGPLRVTMSQRGISTSIGAGPFRITHGADGKTRRTVRVPGTGVYDTKVVGGNTPPRPAHTPAHPAVPAACPAVRPSGGMIFGACLTALPIWFFFANGLWFLGVGGIIGVLIALMQDINKTRQQQQQQIAASANSRLTVSSVSAPTQGSAVLSDSGAAHVSTPVEPNDAALAKALARAADDVDALQPWLDHPELGQAANVLRGAVLVATGRPTEALDCFEAVLAEPPSATSEAFFTRYPVPVHFQAAGIETAVNLSRTAAATYAATIYQTRADSRSAMDAIEQADDSDLVTALKSTYAFNLERFDDVLQITRWVPMPAATPLDAFALILRGCALREKGQPAAGLDTFAAAAAASAEVPDVTNRLTFEVGRTLAAQGNVVAARRKYIQVHRADPNFPELEEALAALPLTP
jgi:tetratricopeptide (TPR) repeat protein